jgi:transcriptional regulator with XRE-family HTH domain
MNVRRRQAEEEKLRRVLRERRLAEGIRQTDLAGRLGRPQSFVSKYESGERRLDFLDVRDICRVLGLSFREVSRRFE